MEHNYVIPVYHLRECICDYLLIIPGCLRRLYLISMKFVNYIQATWSAAETLGTEKRFLWYR